MAERDTAVHAPRALLAQHLHGQGQVHLAVVGDALGDGPLRCGATRVLEKSGARGHQPTSSSCARSARRYSSGMTLTKRSRD